MANLILKSNIPSKLLRNHHTIQPHLTHNPTTRSFHNASKPNTSIFKITPEIRSAITTGVPVVALESQIYTHGHGYPPDFAVHLESIVRKHGAVPATIAVLDGIARVGMSEEELLRVADSVGREGTVKVSRRDLGFVCRLVGLNFVNFVERKVLIMKATGD